MTLHIHDFNSIVLLLNTFIRLAGWINDNLNWIHIGAKILLDSGVTFAVCEAKYGGWDKNEIFNLKDESRMGFGVIVVQRGTGLMWKVKDGWLVGSIILKSIHIVLCISISTTCYM